MKYAGAVYEARTYGSVRGMRRKPHPTRYSSVVDVVRSDILSPILPPA